MIEIKLTIKEFVKWILLYSLLDPIFSGVGKIIYELITEV